MPIYEYEPIDWNCLICNGRFGALQTTSEEPLKFCPDCGMPVSRVISKASIKILKDISADNAARHGLTTFKKSETGKWEKVAGPGVDMIVSKDEDFAAIEAEKVAKPVLDLDKSGD